MNTIFRTSEFDAWLDALRDSVAVAAITARIDRARFGNFGYSEPVGEGVWEMKIDIGPGYRVYYVKRPDVLVILLCGGNKGTQKKDIKRAKLLAKSLEE